jgi:phenylpropionate dioxygenase-like ring-hydroxylating dioxygenase large terminal subunit
MLSPEENAKLTQVEGQTPMGAVVRRYWQPFLLSMDLPEPDCDPVRVRLLGENLVAFRDSSGKAGLVYQHCPHRMADLFYGRNEEGGLRCIYHGWKYDVAGNCVEAPTEPKESNFASKIHLRSYPVEERAGILWTYMGPAHLSPELPDFEFMHVPDSHRFVSWSTQDCNYAQAIEGGIDTIHSVYLHSSLDSHRRLEEYKRSGAGNLGGVQARLRTRDNPPILFAENTDYGVLVGGRYKGDEAEDYWRYNLFLLPYYSMPPGAPGQKLCHAFVPLDDTTTARWSITWSLEKPLAARDVASMRAGSGVHAQVIPGTHTPVRNRGNDYLIDRTEQRTLTFTGIRGTGEQDFSVQEGMGPICDRSEEHLGVTDVGIIQMRRRLLEDAANLEKGVEPYAAGHGDVYRIHAGDAVLPSEVTNWADDQNTRKALAAKW